jgi:hypothetical protein
MLRAIIGDQVPGIAIAIIGPEGIREMASAGFADLATSVVVSPGDGVPLVLDDEDRHSDDRYALGRT